MNDSPSSTRNRLSELALLLPLALYGFALIRTAWLADDAYISFRTVNNLLEGHGPVWNPGERVQSFTHPLWFFVMTALRAVTGEFHHSVMVFSMILALVGVALAGFAGRSVWWRRALLLTLCVASRAFVDYSTSGLENPLSHLILVLFCVGYFRSTGRTSGSFATLILLASLGVLNRQDAFLIYAPPLMLILFERLKARGGASGASSAGEGLRVVGALVAGLLPLIVWECFSIFYYGFPFPNTAYAKLNTGIPRPELLEQGMYYIGKSIEHDPLTVAVIVLGLAAGFLEKNGRFRALAVGVTLYVAYVIWIGGDFMAGRFLALPFWAALLILLNASLASVPTAGRWLGGAILGGIGLFSTFAVQPAAPLLSGPTYPDRREYALAYDWRGIGDERGGYYPWTGLLRAEPERRSPKRHPWSRMGRRLRADPPAVYIQDAIGFIGWTVGDAGYILDPNALADPLLARLPAMQEPAWRIGHFMRAMPPGYLATLVLGENRLRDPGLSAYYDDLRLVTRGPLFSPERFKAIVRLNLTGGPEIGDPEFFRAPRHDPLPGRRHYRAAAFEERNEAPPLPAGDSFSLYWPEVGHQEALVMRSAARLDYDVEIARGGVGIGWLEINRTRPGARLESGREEGAIMIPVPEAWAEAGYDTVRFFPRGALGVQPIESIRRVEHALPDKPSAPSVMSRRGPLNEP